MCPIWPLHFIFLYLLLFLFTFYAVLGASAVLKSNAILEPDTVSMLHMSETKPIKLTVLHFNCPSNDQPFISLRSAHPDIVTCSISKPMLHKFDGTYSTSFNITGNFMGKSEIVVQYKCKDEFNTTNTLTSLPVTVIRKERLIDKIFTISVAVLVSIIFINFGCALNVTSLKDSFQKPCGIILGVICQFIFMPLISYVLARLIFPESIPLQLGLFFSGISPSGGASNIWIYTLGGNLNLSIAITALSNIFAFFTMPFWTFTLGHTIFDKGAMVVPYRNVATFAFALLPPLLVGLMLQKKQPKFSRLMVRILKPFSSFLILFIIIFATVTNWYLFKLFTAEILIAGFLLPFIGYASAWLMASFFRRSFEDCLAISIETGVQNTGIAIFMLRFSLGQPDADLTTVVPVAVALMTPVPILVLFFLRKCVLREAGGDKGTAKDTSSGGQTSATALMDPNAPHTQLHV